MQQKSSEFPFSPLLSLKLYSKWLNAILLDSRAYKQWILFLFGGTKKGNKKQNHRKIKRRNPEAKMAFPFESLSLRGAMSRITRSQDHKITRSPRRSGWEGPPPSRERRLSRSGECAGGCAAAAAGTAGWPAAPPGSSQRTGSGCRQRRRPASGCDWPGRPPAGCLCPCEHQTTNRTVSKERGGHGAQGDGRAQAPELYFRNCNPTSEMENRTAQCTELLSVNEITPESILWSLSL